MQKKPFMIIVLAILLVQPVVVGLSMPFSFNLVEPSRVLAQDAGNRIELGDLINHVPIHIDGTDDFVLQGWPGSGTPADPYIIAGLNITQDMTEGSIYIRNTNASFVVRDCNIYQGLGTYAVVLVNTTAATFEYTTIESAAGGVSYVNANDTVFDHSVITSGSTYAFDLQSSSNCEFHYNEITSNFRIIHGTYSHNITSSYNTYTGNPSWYSTYMQYCNGSSYSFDTWLDGYSLNMANSYDLSFTDVSVDNAGGLQLTVGDGLKVLRSNFTSNSYRGIYAFLIPNIVIQDTYVQSIGQDGIYLGTSENVTITNTVVEHTNNKGIYISNCDNTYISGSSTFDTGDDGISILSSDNVTIIDNEISESDNRGIYVENSINGSVVNNIVNDCFFSGIVLTDATNWTITDNQLSVIGLIGINIDGANSTILRNTIDIANDGIVVTGVDNVSIIDNHLSGIDNIGFEISNSDWITIAGNTLDMANLGLKIGSCDNATIEGNILTSIITQGFEIINCEDGIIRSNSITGGFQGGFYLSGVTDFEFIENTLVDSGFLVEIGPLTDYLHVLENNTVNGLPIYYNPGATGVNILASDYGQILLVNNTWMDVHDGTFGIATIPIEVGYSDNCDFWNLDTSGNFLGMVFLVSDNTTVHDIVHEGTPLSGGVVVVGSSNFSLLDSTLRNVRSGVYGAFMAMDTIDLFINGSVFDSNYEAIQIESGVDVLISHNEILNSEQYGIHVASSASNYIRVLNNNILNSSDGIYVENAYNWTIMDNTIMYSSSYGIRVTGTTADDLNITQNTIENNWAGINIQDGDFATITNNSIRWNEEYGVYLSGSSGSTVYYNIITLNRLGNGYDSLAGNVWDDGVDTGNWWDDFTPPAPYVVSGGGSVDNYPMQYAPTEPVISQPQDLYYPEGSEGNELTWFAFDDSLKNWAVTIDGGAWAAEPWDFVNITVNIDGLSYGTHTVEITLWDVDLNSVTDTVLVHVFDDTPPTISNTPNTEAFVEGTGQTLSWEVSDLHADTYTVYLNDVEWSSGSWTSGTLEIGIDGMAVGEHTLLMVISDIDGNTASDQVLILVISDDVAPTVNSPDDVTYIVGETGNVIVWEPSDENPSWFEVTYGGSILVDGAWSGARVFVNVDGLTNGTHTFRLTIYDGSGNSVDDTVVVTVVPPTPDATPPPPPLDLGLIGIVVAAIGGIVVVIVIITLYRKKAPY